MSVQRHESVIEWAQANADNLERDDYFERPSTDGDGEFYCEECGRRCTRSTKTGIEYGHTRGHASRDDTDCPNRPDSVNPNKAYCGQTEGSE